MGCQTLSWQWAICSAAHSRSQKPKTSSKVSSRRNWHTSMRKANTPVDMSSLSRHHTHTHRHMSSQHAQVGRAVLNQVTLVCCCTYAIEKKERKGKQKKYTLLGVMTGASVPSSSTTPMQQHCASLRSATTYKAACMCKLVKCPSQQQLEV